MRRESQETKSDMLERFQTEGRFTAEETTKVELLQGGVKFAARR